MHNKYIFIYKKMCMYVCMYIYIYIYSGMLLYSILGFRALGFGVSGLGP